MPKYSVQDEAIAKEPEIEVTVSWSKEEFESRMNLVEPLTAEQWARVAELASDGIGHRIYEANGDLFHSAMSDALADMREGAADGE